MSFLKLDLEDAELEKIGDSRNMEFYCKDTCCVPSESVLERYVEYLDKTEFDDQK